MSKETYPSISFLVIVFASPKIIVFFLDTVFEGDACVLFGENEVPTHVRMSTAGVQAYKPRAWHLEPPSPALFLTMSSSLSCSW